MLKQLLTLTFIVSTSLAMEPSSTNDPKSINLSDIDKVNNLTYRSQQEFKELMNKALQSPEKRQQLKDLDYKALASWGRIGHDTFVNIKYLKKIREEILQDQFDREVESSSTSDLESIDSSDGDEINNLADRPQEDFKVREEILQDQSDREVDFSSTADLESIDSSDGDEVNNLADRPQEELKVQEEILQNQFDREYDAFLEENFGLKPLHTYEIDIYDHFADNWQYSLNQEDIIFPPGKYSRLSSTWHEIYSDKLLDVNKKAQGWKIHVSAMPNSAKKIGELVLDVLRNNKFPSQQNKKIVFKLIRSIPHLRTLNALRYAKGLESQAGKFFVVYPESIKHAYELAEALDNAILQEKSAGYLSDEDFLPLVGDAIVGHSNQVYVRYGAYQSDLVKKVDPSDISMIITEDKLDRRSFGGRFTEDDRFTPWPDFMNKGNSTWEKAPSPFKELPLKWNKDNKETTWETRPNSWEELYKSEIEISKIIEDIEQDKDLENAAEEQLKELNPIVDKQKMHNIMFEIMFEN